MSLNGAVLASDAQVLCTLNEVMDHLAIPTAVHTESESMQRALALNRFDSIVLDMDNPDAGKVLRLIRESDHNSRALILAITSDAANAREAFESGANFVLHKPLSPMQTSSCIRTGYSTLFRNRRRHARVAANIAASIAFGSRRINGTILDVSKGGLALRCEAKVDIGQVVSVAFKLPGDKETVNATGAVVWADVKRIAGLRFTFVPEADLRRIERWLANA